MINVAQCKADLAAVPGDHVIVPKSQMTQLYAEVEHGQFARRALSSIKTITAIAANSSAVPA